MSTNNKCFQEKKKITYLCRSHFSLFENSLCVNVCALVGMGAVVFGAEGGARFLCWLFSIGVDIFRFHP